MNDNTIIIQNNIGFQLSTSMPKAQKTTEQWTQSYINSILTAYRKRTSAGAKFVCKWTFM